MAGSFTSPNAGSKMKLGKANRPKRTDEDATGLSAQPRDYPITNSFAADTIPTFASRRAKTNNKHAFCSCPAKPPAGRLAQRSPGEIREAGKVLGSGEKGRSANSHGSGGTQRK
jgi:hypothetical protein